MKIEHKTNRYIKSKNVEEFAYTLNSESKIMEYLSDSLYSNKPAAIIRELSCNAHDSHIEANNPDPFEIYLPVVGDEKFKIRDYGTGMSPEFLQKKYTSIGFSDKTDDNNRVGCFGIGSFSPFSYADQFLTISYYNGVKYSYVNSKDNQNKPKLIKLGESLTNEKNGIEISFNVKKDDFKSFYNAAKDIFFWFDYKPKIVRKPSSYKVENYLDYRKIFNNKWSLFHSETNVPLYNYFSVLMGNICYPVDSSQISIPKNINSNHIVLHLSIGSLISDTSREKIQYTKEIRSLLQSKIDEFANEIDSHIKNEINNQPNYYSALCYYDDLNYWLKPENPKWRKFDLKRNLYHPFNITDKNQCVKFFPQENKFEKGSFVLAPYNLRDNKLKEVNFLVNDIKNKKIKGFKQARALAKELDKPVWLLQDECTVKVPGQNIYYLSDRIDKKYSIVNNKSLTVDNCEVLKLKDGESISYYFSSSDFEPVEIDYLSDGFYIPIFKYKIEGEYQRAYSNLESLGFLNKKKVFFVRKRYVKKYKKMKKLSDHWEGFKKVYKPTVNKREINIFKFKNFSCQYLDLFTRIDLPPGELKKIVNIKKKCNKTKLSNKKIAEINLFDLKGDNLIDKYKAILDKYPMFKLIQCRYHYSDIFNIKDYKQILFEYIQEKAA